ncbi:MAG: phytanoyl-CoA dioxygenase family protein, partial [Polyangiaceae bacterium]
MNDLESGTQEAITHWREHGWARLGRVAGEGQLAALRARAADVMQGRVVHEGLFFQHDAATGRYEDLEFGRGWVGPSDAYRKVEKLERDPVFRAWIENPVFERLVRAVVGDPVSLYRATLFSKSALGGTELPWHQDGGSFWGLDRDPELQLWTALDDVPAESGCVEV